MTLIDPILKIQTILGIDAKTIYEELTQALGSDTPSDRTVRRCTQRFRQEREYVNNDYRSDRPVSVLTDENIERVWQVIEDDLHSTYDDIIAEITLSHDTIGRIIHDCLKTRNPCKNF
ncbi:unnamed protein product [Rotaria sordida]|uniref:Mos1 transposase HTH domain-containing protein n=1 Tax=Rotaria sordida TaxID=392033 RepID=A0A815FPG0_9BILA|nr:unnamed protein product [Rotaria sordida]